MQYFVHMKHNSAILDAFGEFVKVMIHAGLEARLILFKCYSPYYIPWLEMRPRNPQFLAVPILHDYNGHCNSSEIS